MIETQEPIPRVGARQLPVPFPPVPATIFEPPYDKTNEMICAPSEVSDQPGLRCPHEDALGP